MKALILIIISVVANFSQNIFCQSMKLDTICLQSELQKRHCAEARITLLENRQNLIPIKRLDTLRVASISIGPVTLSPFQTMLEKYTKVDHFNVATYSNAGLQPILKKLVSYNLIIIGTDSVNQIPAGLVNNVSAKYIQVLFSGPKALQSKYEKSPDGLILAFQNDTISQELSAQMIFGGMEAKGKLPEAAGMFPAGSGIAVQQPVRLGYTIPEEAGINSVVLKERIDSLISDAINQHAFPGCNILVAAGGKVIFHQVYGFHTYENIVPASKDDIYDLASVTKVTSALPAIMKLNGEGKINLDEKFSTYWTDWQRGLFHRSNKSDIVVRELLAHQAGLPPFMPFWKQTVKHNKLSPKWYRVEQDDKYQLMVAPGLYLKNDFKKNVYKAIRRSELKDRGKYVYSDLFFVIAPEVIAKLSATSYLKYLDSCFYRPLGAGTMTYTPTLKFSIDRIVPTEDDNYFRKRQLQGSVHDEASAVLGGISGNAGLFSTANDLAKLLQMYLQGGVYGGEQYLKEDVLKEFTRVQYPQNNNRRGLGFDKPLLNNSTLTLKDSYPSPNASAESFGHSGYTGTFFWIDPKYKLVYIMLANRVYPTRNNTKLIELSIRTKLQQIIYDELLKQQVKLK